MSPAKSASIHRHRALRRVDCGWRKLQKLVNFWDDGAGLRWHDRWFSRMHCMRERE
jgi:hypothetical protein